MRSTANELITQQHTDRPAWRRLAMQKTLVDANSEFVNAVKQLVSDSVRSDDEQWQAEQTVEDTEDAATCRQRRSIAVAWTTRRGHLHHMSSGSHLIVAVFEITRHTRIGFGPELMMGHLQ